MTKLLDMAIDTAHRLSPHAQDDLARLMLAYASETILNDELTPQDEAAVLRSRAAADRGEIATDAHMSSIWAKHGL